MPISAILKAMEEAAKKPKLSFWQKIRTTVHRLLRDQKGTRYFFIALVIIIASGIGLFAFIQQPLPKTTLGYTFTPPPEVKKYYSALTGLEVPDEASVSKPTTAIMLENSPDARPQSGLKNAEVVFEAIAEGGITRFLAIYQQEKPQLIGPVRSLRPYYLAWATPFDASIAHIGGSFLALQEVRNGSFRDIDEFFNSSTYWRATDRYAPHNVYTSFERLDALNAQKNYATSNSQGFARQAIPKRPSQVEQTPGDPANSLTVDISGPLYNSSYTYDATSKHYVRSQGGAPHVDREQGPITPKVVIVMKTKMSLGFEDGYREQIEVVGSGEAIIFQDGKVITGKWRKNSKGEQLQFTTQDDKPLALVRGQTWLTIIPDNRGVTWQ